MGAGSQVFCVRSQAWGEPLWRDADRQRAGAVCSMTVRAALIGLLVLIAVPDIAVAAETVAAAAETARAEAKRWKPDAALIGIVAAPQPDGTLGSGRGAMFTFRSRSTGEGLMVAVGDGKPTVIPMPTDPAAVPLPDRFLDLTEAVAAARKQGVGPVMQATIKAYPTAKGPRTAWELAGGSGTIMIDAESGAATSFDALSGLAEANQRQEAASRTEELPPGTATDFASLRRRADAEAARQNPPFKLYEVEVALASKTLQISGADFHYFRPSAARGAPASGWEDLVVHIAAPKSWMNGRRRIDQPGQFNVTTSDVDDPKPSPAPANILDPDEATRRLNRPPMPMAQSSRPDPDPSRWVTQVQLILIGANYHIGTQQLAPSSPAAGDASLGRDPFFNRTAPRGKWVWWTIVRRPDVPGEELHYIYMDAQSGQATISCMQGRGDKASAIACPSLPDQAMRSPQGSQGGGKK